MLNKHLGKTLHRALLKPYMPYLSTFAADVTQEAFKAPAALAEVGQLHRLSFAVASVTESNRPIVEHFTFEMRVMHILNASAMN